MPTPYEYHPLWLDLRPLGPVKLSQRAAYSRPPEGSGNMVAAPPRPGTATTALEVLEQQGWHPSKTTTNPKRTYQGPCPVGSHENDHQSPGFSLAQDGQAFYCFKCDLQGYGPHQMLSKLGQEPIRAQPYRPPTAKPKGKLQKQRGQLQGATLEGLAEAKGLDVAYLRHLGWHQTTHRGVQAVAMPYKDQQGDNALVKYRVGIDEGIKTLWPKGTTILPMGLQELPYAREHGFIILEEGETDWVTFDYHGFPALGLPGVHAWKIEWLAYTSGIKKIYVWEESGGKPNQQGLTPGQQMVKRVADAQGEVWVIKAPADAKDACELAQVAGADFADRVLELLEGAERYTGEDYSPPPTGLPTKTTPGEQASRSRAPWGQADNCTGIHTRETKAAARRGKPVNTTTLAYRHQQLRRTLDPKNAEFCHLHEGEKLCILGSDCICVVLENPVVFMSHSQLMNLAFTTLGIVDLDGQEVPITKALSECGKAASMNCDVDGPQYDFKHACRSPLCPNCNTKQSIKVGRCQLPDLAPDQGAYVEYWIETRHPLPESTARWEAEFATLMNTWEAGITKIARRKAFDAGSRIKGTDGGLIFYRSHQTYYTESEAQTHWKLMVWEQPGREAMQAQLVAQLAGWMGGAVSDERRYVNGQQAVFQIANNTMAHLAGIDPAMPLDMQKALFAAHYWATRGRHIFQGRGLFFKMLAALEALPPPRCERCGLKLREVIHDTNPEHEASGCPNGLDPPRH